MLRLLMVEHVAEAVPVHFLDAARAGVEGVKSSSCEGGLPVQLLARGFLRRNNSFAFCPGRALFDHDATQRVLLAAVPFPPQVYGCLAAWHQTTTFRPFGQTGGRP
jgi:hypothetical protein